MTFRADGGIILLAYLSPFAGVMELADVLDSKSSPGNRVRVRPPPPAPLNSRMYIVREFFLLRFAIKF